MKKNTYADYEMTLTAGQYLAVQAHGEWFKLTANSVATELMVQIDGQPEQKMPVGRTIRLAPVENYTTIGLRNPAGSSAAIRFVVSNGEVKDDSVDIANEVDAVTVGNSLSTPAKGTATTAAPGSPAIAAAAGNRLVVVQNHGANPIWWGDANVDGANLRGIKIPAGEGYEIPTAAAIYFRTTGGNSDYSYAVISKV